MLSDQKSAGGYIECVSLSKLIGERLSKARGDRTLQEISNNTNKSLSVSRISNYERGIRTPGPKEAIALARALGNISAAEILCVDDSSTLDSREKALLAHFRAADDRGKDTIARIAEAQTAYRVDPDDSD